MTYITRDSNIARRPRGISFSSRLCSSHNVPTLSTRPAILSSLSMTMSHSSLFCFTSCQCTRKISDYCESNGTLASRIVSAWRRRPATGAMKGILPARALASFRAARDVSIAFIAVSPRPPIGSDEAGLWRAAS
jgi:hypothetical protein